MKKFNIFLILALFISGISLAQTSAMGFSGVNCYGNPVDLFADLDAGKAVVLHFYMPSCASCPPSAQTIQTMANDIMETFPDMIKGYAFPFQNSTDCDYSISWVEDNDLSLYAPMDSGATQVAYYGGFGMPTVVLLGGTDYRVMFSTLSFTSGDTSEMADSILALFGVTPTAINSIGELINLSVSPNPANAFIDVNFSVNTSGEINILLMDIAGNVISELKELAQPGTYSRKIETNVLPEGIYIMRITAEGILSTAKFTVVH